MRDNDTLESCLYVILMVIVLVALSFLYAAIACWLWGVIAVAIFGLPVLTYWQMFGLIWLLKLILPTATSSYHTNK